jgi:hypothetical protein
MLCEFIEATFTDRVWKMPKVPTLIGIVDPTPIPLGGENVTLSSPAHLE